MQPISGITHGAAGPSVPVAGVDETKKVRRPAEESQEHSRRPVTDEYVPEEKPEPSGRYWLGRDGDGKPKICFDDPERAENALKESGDDPGRSESAEAAEKSGSGKNAERCTCNTDQVDREIEKLKKQKQELERRINQETDEAKADALNSELARVEEELRQKDNDAYRRQHAVYTFS